MNSFFPLTLNELKEKYKTQPAREATKIQQIIKAIQKKKTDTILKKSDLTQYENNYIRLNKKTLPELDQFLKESINTSPVIDILIAIYIRSGSETKLIWSRSAPALHLNKYRPQDLAFIRHQNNLKPTHQPEKSITKYIHGRRTMPSSAPFPGIYDAYKVQYMVEIRDNMGPYSGVDYQSLKKGVQTGGTAGGVEDCIAYYWNERPADQMYLTGTEGLLKKFNTKRLGPLMDSAGLVASSQTYSKKSRKTGDTIEIKEYWGGNLTMGSIQSGAHARSDSIRIMYVDEIDLAETQMASGEGNVLDVLDGRLTAFEGRSKMFSLSTPREYGNSLIDIQFERGDKRKFFVQCPFCEKFQWLCQGDEKSNYGLKGDYTAGVLQNGYYLCFFCHNAMFEGHKELMLKNGFWQPTVERPAVKNNRSYHLPSFYSPFMSWKKMHQKYAEAQKEGDAGMRSYTNLYLGKSFEPTGEQPEFKSVIEIRSKYKSGEVPPGILYLTMFVDVQRGMDKFKDYTQEEITTYAKKHKNNHVRLQELPRLEAEVMGHGAQFRTASIIWNTIYGQINNYTLGAWDQLREWIEPGLVFKRRDGFEFPVQTILIDSGDGMYSDLVYNFCSPLPSTYASKGAGTPKKDKLKLVNIDTMIAGNIYNIKLSKQANGQNIVLINTNYYKSQIYFNFKNVSQGSDEQIPSSHITPSDYPDFYFQQLRAEKQKTDGTFHNPANKRNEALDSLVGNKAASDFIIQGFIEADREKLKRKYPALRAKTREVDEKLRELVSRETVTFSIIEELIKIGWGKNDS